MFSLIKVIFFFTNLSTLEGRCNWTLFCTPFANFIQEFLKMKHQGELWLLPTTPPIVLMSFPLTNNQWRDCCHMSLEALSGTTSHNDWAVKHTATKSPTVLLTWSVNLSVYVCQRAVESCTAGSSIWRHPISIYFHTPQEKNNPESLIVSDHLLLRRNETRLDECKPPPMFHPDRPPLWPLLGCERGFFIFEWIEIIAGPNPLDIGSRGSFWLLLGTCRADWANRKGFSDDQ